MEEPRVSPDGTHLAYIATIQGERAWLMRDLQGKARRARSCSSRAVPTAATHCEFKTDNRLLCQVKGLQAGFGGHAYPTLMLFAIDRDGSHKNCGCQQDQIVHFAAR